MEDLPEEMSKLQSLIELQVRWNGLTEFPECVPKLVSLQVKKFNLIH